MTAPHQKPPFRAEHVGSLLRPDRLRRAFRQASAGEITTADFCAVQDDCIREAVRLQESVGLRAVNDGEFRRTSYWSHVVEGVDGLDVAPARFRFHDDCGHDTAFLSPRVTGWLRRVRPLSGPEYDFVAAATRRTVKVTLPSPPTMHFWAEAGSARRAGYASKDAYFADLARVYREELADLAARGCTYVQLDEVPLAMLCDPHIREAVWGDGQDPDALIDRYIGLVNSALRDRRPEMTVAMHLCRGNFKALWLAEGGYEALAERLFGEVTVDTYFLEYDTARAGGFAPLARVPAPKQVVLGLVSSKTPALEPVDTLRRRIDEAARYVPLERLALSPQCGFASAVSGNPVTEADQRRKLARVVETADKVWGGV